LACLGGIFFVFYLSEFYPRSTFSVQGLRAVIGLIIACIAVLYAAVLARAHLVMALLNYTSGEFMGRRKLTYKRQWTLPYSPLSRG
jgi:hypothetical protein